MPGHPGGGTLECLPTQKNNAARTSAASSPYAALLSINRHMGIHSVPVESEPSRTVLHVLCCVIVCGVLCGSVGCAVWYCVDMCAVVCGVWLVVCAVHSISQHSTHFHTAQHSTHFRTAQYTLLHTVWYYVEVCAVLSDTVRKCVLCCAV